MTSGNIQVTITIVMQTLFAVSGIIGNALVLCVFSRIKHKRSTTIFILTLASVDFVTCLVTIPFTIVYITLEHKLKYDSMCKLYYFLITSTVPLSAFIMTAIAFDRYVTICHPFLQLMNVKRARIIVGLLTCFAVIIGILSCLQFGMYKISPYESLNNTVVEDIEEWPDTMKYGEEKNITLSRKFIDNEFCTDVDRTFDPDFLFYFQKIYASFYAICAVIVIVLYSLILKSVVIWQKKGLNVGQRTPHFENTDDTNMSDSSNDLGFEEIEVVEITKSGTEEVEQSINLNDTSMSGPRNVSRLELRKRRMANVKTAFMLFIVAIVFITAFLPAWLMALTVIPYSIVVFYMYFVYHIANPVIYAFVRKGFRQRLKPLCKCR